MYCSVTSIIMLLKSMYSVACACLPSLLCMWCSAFWIRDACTLVVCCRTPCWHCCQARVLLCSVSVLALRYCFQFKKTVGGSALQTSYSSQSFYYNQQNVRTTMDKELNGQRTQWTKNSMDKEQQWTKNSMDKELNGQRTTMDKELNGQRTTMDKELNGQRTQWTKNSTDKELNGQRTQWTKNNNGQRTQWTKNSMDKEQQWTKNSTDKELNGQRTTMDKELNGQRTQWTKNNNGQRTQWTKNSMDKELNGQRTQWTKNSMDKELNGFKRVTTTAWKTISDSVPLLWRKGSNDHCPCCHFLYMHCAVVLYMTFYLQQDLEDMRPCRCTLL